MGALLATAAEAGEVRPDVAPMDLLHAISRLCRGTDPDADQRMVDVLIDGLRYGAQPGTA